MPHLSEPKISSLECIICQNLKFPSLNASSPLKCLFKPKGRAWAAGGGPEASSEKSAKVRCMILPRILVKLKIFLWAMFMVVIYLEISLAMPWRWFMVKKCKLSCIFFSLRLGTLLKNFLCAMLMEPMCLKISSGMLWRWLMVKKGQNLVV